MDSHANYLAELFRTFSMEQVLRKEEFSVDG